MKEFVNLSHLEETKNFLLERWPAHFDTAIILGTGLGSLEEEFKVLDQLSYGQIPHVPKSTTESHKGSLLRISKDGSEFLMLSGRWHYYEGYSAAESTYMIHVLYALGIRNLIITNAVGGVNPHFNQGDVLVISDHINLFPEHPLRGKNHNHLGPKFPDMSEAYDQNLIRLAKEIADKKSVSLHEGIYFGWPGPSLETPAEYRMIHRLGADVVGMSTIPEVLVANYYQMKVLCFSVVSNVCYPKERIRFTTVEEVIEVVNSSAEKLNQLIPDICMKLETLK